MKPRPLIPASDQSPDRAGGHWILARLGKKVLRPGGRETTDFLLENLPIAGRTVVEFAPGLGVTAKEILAAGPAHYIGVDSDTDACANVQAIASGTSNEVINASATDSGLADLSADIIIGEAMLTMQSDKHKIEIMREAARILVPGGFYAIHELILTPDDASEELKTTVRTDLARAIKVNARPLTVPEWINLAGQAGFEEAKLHRADMALLSPLRTIKDEGVLGTAKILFNVLRQPALRARVMTMRSTFTTHKKNIGAVGIIFKKTTSAQG